MASFEQRLNRALASVKPHTLEEMVQLGQQVFGNAHPEADLSQGTEPPGGTITAGSKSSRKARWSRRASSVADQARAENVERSQTVLLAPSRRDLTREAFIAACLEPLVEALAATCRWSAAGRDWKVGDYRCLAMCGQVGDEAFSVHWWAEPLGEVQAGVTFGATQRIARRFLAGERLEALVAMGYVAVDDRFGWFTRDVSLEKKAEIRAEARDALATVFDVFGYRGRTALALDVGHGTRATRDDVYQALMPRDLWKLIDQCGLEVEFHPAEGDEPPYVEVTEGGEVFLVSLDWPEAGNRYGLLRFVLPVKERTRQPMRVVNEINQSIYFGRLARDPDGLLLLEMHVRIRGGATAAYVHYALADWHHMRRLVRRMIRAAERAPA